MNILNKTIKASLATLLIFMSFFVFAQQPGAPAKKGEARLSAATVENSLATMGNLIINGYPDKKNSESKVIAQSLLKNYETTLKSYYEHPDIEKATLYSREWYGKLFKLVQEMGKCSAEMNVAIIRLQSGKIPILKTRYENLQKSYKETYEKPERAKPSR